MPEKRKIDIQKALETAAGREASDLHLKPGQPPLLRISGRLNRMDQPPLTREDTFRIAYDLMSDEHRGQFQRRNEVDFSFQIEDISRFRANVFRSRDMVQITVRLIPLRIPGLKDLNLPSKLADIALLKQGLVLVTGPTGSGKSTTLAAMTEIINTNRSSHVVTLEDPIEFLFEEKKSIITQREIGRDSMSMQTALNNVFREDPDVLLIGEIRSRETLETALVASETGHLVLSTLHTSGAAATVSRVIDMFPGYQSQQIRSQLSGVLQAIFSMKLLPRMDMTALIPAVELLIATPLVKDLILEPGRERELPEAMERGRSQYGMLTLDNELARLYRSGIISEEEALSAALNPSDLALKISGLVSHGSS
ncbi:PilT/PilU family type 4a pilus ATPase [Candidatus Fermentibacteria bacterium]|nr:PilT/PilU family type 4a pilus ATPase [Candidatus Fermentibacteria bacterium]